MKHWRYLAIALGLYLAMLAILAPAELADFWLGQASGGRLRLAGANGTLWNGSGTLEIRNSANRAVVSKDVAWRVLPASMWRGRLVCEISLDGAASRLVVAASPSTADIYNAAVTLPVVALSLAEPRLKPLRLSGVLSLQSDQLTIAQDSLKGILRVQWRDAGSELSPVSPIGAYELRLEGQGGAVQAFLSTLQGPLQLDGSGSWGRDRRFELNATIRVPAPYQEQLTPLLRLFSVQRDEGTFEVQLK